MEKPEGDYRVHDITARDRQQESLVAFFFPNVKKKQ